MRLVASLNEDRLALPARGATITIDAADQVAWQ